MIRDVAGQNVVMDVYLKNNDEHYDCDIPSKPFGDYDRMISFWTQDGLEVYPLEAVYRVVIREVKTEPENDQD